MNKAHSDRLKQANTYACNVTAKQCLGRQGRLISERDLWLGYSSMGFKNRLNKAEFTEFYNAFKLTLIEMGYLTKGEL